MANQPVKQDSSQSKVVGFSKSEIFFGPLPHPEILEKYEQILPGAAERILSMAETQSRHRIGLETRVVDADITNSKRGLIFGFTIGLVGIGGGIYSIHLGHVISGSLLTGGALASLVGTFVYGSHKKRAEIESKQGKPSN